MGLYKQSILERERYAKELEYNAESALCNNIEPEESFKNKIDSVCDVLDYILDKFKIVSHSVKGCETISELLECTLEPLGVMYEEISLQETDLKKRSEYIMAFLENGKAVVLVPTIRGYYYLSPDTGQKKRITKKSKLQEKAYIFYKPFLNTEFSFRSLIFYILKLISPRDFIPMAIASALVTLLGLATPAINYWVLGTLIYQYGAYKELIFGAVMFITVGFISCIIRTTRTVVLGSIEIRISAQVQSAVMARTLLLPHSFFVQSSSGKLSKRIGISRTIAEKLVRIVLDTLLNVIFSLVYIPQMENYAPSLYIPAILILIAQVVVSIITSIAYARNQVKVTDAQMEVSQILFSTLKGIQKIKGFGSARLIYAKWAASYRKMLLHSLNPPIWVKLSGVLSVLIASFGTVLLIGIMVPSKVGLEHYIAFNSSYSLMASTVSELLTVIQSIFLMKPLMNYMKPIFDTKIEQDPEAEYVKHLDGNIELKNIKFCYPGTNNDVLKDVSIKIKKGEKIAIVGKSGCGKSTLLKILMGLESPQSGNVYFDGKSIDTLNKCSLRKRIGSVFQFGRVMPGTIASNISFTTTDLSDTDLWDAAEKAHIANYIKTLDMGMETEVTQSNVGGFSGGQKQCILLARAFASKPSILILDEATSALDNITQRKVLKSIFNMDASVIMVAHRLSTVKDCDRIIVLKDGRITEEGTYRELMKINGYFAKLVNRQV